LTIIKQEEPTKIKTQYTTASFKELTKNLYDCWMAFHKIIISGVILAFVLWFFWGLYKDCINAYTLK